MSINSIKINFQRALALFLITSFLCDNFPKFLLLYFSQLLKIQLRILPGGLGAEPPSYLIVGCQNWKVLVSWRYDFWDIVDTISELAKTEQGETEVFRNRTDNVRQPYIVRQV